MNTRIALLAASVMAVTAACSSSDPAGFEPPTPNLPQGNFRVQLLHASPDAPAVNVTGFPGGGLTGVDFKDGTGALELAEGTFRGIQIDGILPGDGNTATVIGPVDLTFNADTFYSVLAIGKLDDIAPLILEQPDTAVPAGSTRLRVVHGAPSAPPVTVFLTPPNANLQTTAPVGTFAFAGNLAAGEVGDLGPVDVPAGGPYQIRVTLPFTPPEVATVVFDSGEITLADGANLLITAVDNTTSADPLAMGESPITLVVQDGTGASEILSAGSEAELRVVHASADAPSVDVVVNGNFASPLVPGLSYPDFEPQTGFVGVPAASYDITVTDSATQSVFPIELMDLALDAGVTYDVLAVNALADLEPLLLTDDYRPVATAAKVRIIHASTGAQAASPNGVDIYVTDPDTDLTTVEAPTITGFMFKDNTGFIEVDEGTYDVTVTVEGSTDPAIGPARITVENGMVYTAIARDPDPQVPNDTLGLILMDGFVAP